MPKIDDISLGNYLRERRSRLDPSAFGLPAHRRRTPGLRREEVAQRAAVSTTWYTWLEQGRGGAPSAAVLERIARALLLTDAEHEHLFLLALGHPPRTRLPATDGVTPRLQRVLDSFSAGPALVKTATWDIVAWNRAAAAVLIDYAALAPEERNVLRLLFLEPRVRAMQTDWNAIARFVVATFRVEALRAGAPPRVASLVAEMSALSPEFSAMWSDHEVCHHGEGTKLIRHPVAGLLALEYSAFAVDGRPDLSLVLYTPTTAADALKVQDLVAAHAG